MTNKLPKVGKRYIAREDFYFIKEGEELEISRVDEEKIFFKVRGDIFNAYIDLFLRSCEELLEDNYKQKHTSKTHQLEENTPVEKGCTERENEYFKAGWIGARDMFRPSKEVEKAKEELKSFIKNWYDTDYINNTDPEFLVGDLTRLYKKAQNLLKALDSQKEDKMSDKGISQPNRESKLSWKDVGELWNRKGFDNQDLILKMEDGNFIFGQGYNKDIGPIGTNSFMYYQLKKCITLTDLINSIESTLSRQDELEARITKLKELNNAK